MHALINDREIPVESLKSLVSGLRGRVLIAGATASDEDRRQVRIALSSLRKKDIVSFNVVTSDWRAISGNAKIIDVLLAPKSKSALHFFVVMK